MSSNFSGLSAAVLSLLTVWCCAFSLAKSRDSIAGTEPLGFQRFFKAYGELSLTRLQGENQRLQTLQEAATNEDIHQGSLFVTPSLNHLMRVSPDLPAPNTIRNRSTDIRGGYRQSFSSGTTVELRGQKFFEQSNPLFSAVDQDLSINLAQDLVRNSLGYGRRVQRQLGQAQRLQADEAFRQSELEVCSEAFDLYVNAYTLQQRTNLLRSLFADSQNSYNKLKGQQRQGLIHEVDALSSKNDFLNLQSQLLSAEQELVNGKNQLAIYLPPSQMSALVIPTPEKQMPSMDQVLKEAQNSPVLGPPSDPSAVESSPTSENLRLRAAQRQQQTGELNVTLQKQSTLPELTLNLTMGAREGRFAPGGVPTGFQENYLAASVDWRWPLFQKGASASYRTALAQLKNAKIQQSVLKQNLKVELENLLATEELLKKQLQLSQDQLKDLQRKARLALKQMNSGRIEYETYLLHKNAVRTLQLETLNLQGREWRNRFNIQRFLASMTSSFCSLKAVSL